MKHRPNRISKLWHSGCRNRPLDSVMAMTVNVYKRAYTEVHEMRTAVCNCSGETRTFNPCTESVADLTAGFERGRPSTSVHLRCQPTFQEVLKSTSASLKQQPTPLPLPALTMPRAPLPPTRSAVTTKAVPSDSSTPVTLRIGTSRRTAHTIAPWHASRHPIASAPTMALALWATAASWTWAPPAPHHRAVLLAIMTMERNRLWP